VEEQKEEGEEVVVAVVDGWQYQHESYDVARRSQISVMPPER
jgi:hypothetical protein